MKDKYRAEVSLKCGNIQRGMSFVLHRNEFDDDIQFCQAVASMLFDTIQQDRTTKIVIGG